MATSFSPILSVTTGEILKIDIRVEDSQWVDNFDKLEVHRSRSGESGPYEELTGPVWKGATLAFKTQPYYVVGKVLSLLLNEAAELDVTFTGVDPLSAASIATQIQTQSLGALSAAVVGTEIVVTTMQPGAGASIRVLSSDAAGLFALDTVEPGCVTFGQNARIPLISGQGLYSFQDPNGSKEFSYRTRFRNQATNSVGEYSLVFAGMSITNLDPTDLILGTVDLTDLEGRPLQNVHVLVYSRVNTTLVNGKAIIGGSSDRLTDADGHVEFNLVRGSEVTVGIAGTSIARNVTVPTDVALTTFNLLDPSVGGQDVFQVQVPEYEYAVRRTL